MSENSTKILTLKDRVQHILTLILTSLLIIYFSNWYYELSWYITITFNVCCWLLVSWIQKNILLKELISTIIIYYIISLLIYIPFTIIGLFVVAVLTDKPAITVDNITYKNEKWYNDLHDDIIIESKFNGFRKQVCMRMRGVELEQYYKYYDLAYNEKNRLEKRLDYLTSSHNTLKTSELAAESVGATGNAKADLVMVVVAIGAKLFEDYETESSKKDKEILKQKIEQEIKNIKNRLSELQNSFTQKGKPYNKKSDYYIKQQNYKNSIISQHNPECKIIIDNLSVHYDNYELTITRASDNEKFHERINIKDKNSFQANDYYRYDEYIYDKEIREEISKNK